MNFRKRKPEIRISLGEMQVTGSKRNSYETSLWSSEKFSELPSQKSKSQPFYLSLKVGLQPDGTSFAQSFEGPTNVKQHEIAFSDFTLGDI
ncbi:hypothetical protein AVEN_229522-1 [Araneus ventricosus]|uniref:Uncharacterized protein n=1 Tax=Araneus ventricosus TaxID=182803 RepID=A0A4Y2EJP3_ARAVE|nr:hypothetical protein AVEN_229522-1 [Araneus ventricosus]